MRTRRGSRASSGISRVLVCPACGVGEIDRARCSLCHASLEQWVLQTLRAVVSLPDAAGRHACDCGHPEMHLLPDGVYWCPSCGDEVVPIG